MPFSSTRRVTVLVICSLVAFSVASCHDAPTALGPLAVTPSHGFSRDLVEESPAGGSASLTISGAPFDGAEQFVGHYPTLTIVQADAHQDITITVKGSMDPPGFLGLPGRLIGDGACTHQGEAYLKSGQAFAWLGCSLLPTTQPSSASFPVAVQGDVYYGASFDSACPFPDYACGSYSGSSSVSLTRLDAQIDLTMDPDPVSPSAVPFGHAFRFRAKLTPDHLGSYATPVQYLDGGWTFTNSAGVVRPLDCGLATQDGGACILGFTESGSIQLDALVNGVHMTKGPIAITVIQPKLELTLSDASVFVGDTVLVTTMLTPTGEREDFPGFSVTTQTDPPVGGGGDDLSRVPAQAPTLANKRGVTPQGVQRSLQNYPAGGHSAAAKATMPVPTRSISTPGRLLRANSAQGLPQCGATYPFSKHCYIVLDQVGLATVTVNATYNRLPLTAAKTIRVNGPTHILQLTVDSATIDPFRIATFTASASGAPFVVASWAWRDDKGGTANCSPTTNPCSVLVKQSGTMLVTGTTDGNNILQTASVVVSANQVPCPTGDTLVDQPGIRRVLNQTFMDSYIGSPPTSNKRERGAYIVRDTITGALTAVRAQSIVATACSLVPLKRKPNDSPPNSVVVAFFHSHPFGNQEPFPSTCGAAYDPVTGVMNQGYDQFTFGGLSPNDWAETRKFPMIVMDEDNLYVARQVPGLNMAQITPTAARRNINTTKYTKACRR